MAEADALRSRIAELEEALDAAHNAAGASASSLGEELEAAVARAKEAEAARTVLAQRVLDSDASVASLQARFASHQADRASVLVRSMPPSATPGAYPRC